MKIKIKTKGFKEASIKLRKETKSTQKRIFDLKVRKGIIMGVEKNFHLLKQEYIRRFREHPVTKALKSDGGGGVIPEGRGNLRTFLGLSKSRLEKDLSLVEEAISNSRVFVSTLSNLSIRLTIATPEPEEVFQITPLPWVDAGGRSWIKAIESGGVAGYGHYLFKEEGGFANSTSGGQAIQVKGKVRKSGKASQSKYVSNLLNEFRKEIRLLI